MGLHRVRHDWSDLAAAASFWQESYWWESNWFHDSLGVEIKFMNFLDWRLTTRSEIHFILNRLGTTVGIRKNGEREVGNGKYSWLFAFRKLSISYWWSTLRCKSAKVLTLAINPRGNKNHSSAISSMCVVSYQLFLETQYLLSFFDQSTYLLTFSKTCVIAQNQWFVFFALFFLILPF